MSNFVSGDRIRFLMNQFRERLWVKPLVTLLLSISAVFIASLADNTKLVQNVLVLEAESLEALLSIMASSMLVIATFAVASMVSAYASASNTATPRSFPLIIADDVSQHALSTFVGAFIFSVVALIATKNGYFGAAGLFILFLLTLSIFGIVVLAFIRWVDRIARLGRLGTVIDKVEKATADALKRRRDAPTLHGKAVECAEPFGQAVFPTSAGYVQHVNVRALQSWAEEAQGRVMVAALPGTFVAPGIPLAYVSSDTEDEAEIGVEKVARSFLIGHDRLFDDDPRFGLVVLSEIADRALSPAVNDPGTAIEIVGALVRLFILWSEPATAEDGGEPRYDRVEVPEISVRDMFDDAFTPIARDGAGAVEVAVKLQKALRSLAFVGDGPMNEAAMHHSRLALARAEKALEMPEDLAAVREAAGLTGTDVSRET